MGVFSEAFGIGAANIAVDTTNSGVTQSGNVINSTTVADSGLSMLTSWMAPNPSHALSVGPGVEGGTPVAHSPVTGPGYSSRPSTPPLPCIARPAP